MRLRAIWIDRLTISELEGILSRQSKKHLSSSDDLLFLLKHPPSFSYHKEADLKHIKSSLSYPLIKAERGGGVMYHDEGQLVLAPVVKLREGFGVPEYVYALEETMIRVLNELFSIKGFRIRWSKDGYWKAEDGRPLVLFNNRFLPGIQGVWVYEGGRPSKIGFLGCKFEGGVVSRGCALNIDPDLREFSKIDPCNLPGINVTSVGKLKGMRYEVNCELAKKVAQIFCETMGYEKFLFEA
uniref:lipoyl(octanoyl) transferase n=1 Tax=uncultured prokaryote TaxID=198431 RepID=H5SEM0_9ZZZZ|nr:lipoate-protein ligase B [uncultured prokaryote]